MTEVAQIAPLGRLETFSSTDQASWYLSALIDGEGYVSAPGATRFNVVISNTDLSIIEAAERALDILDVRYKRYEVKSKQLKWSDSYTVQVGRLEEIKKLAGLVHLQCESKASRLAVIADHRIGWLRPDQRPIDKVRRMYLDEELNIYEIGERLGWRPGTIGRWISEDGFMRSRSESSLIRWNKTRLSRPTAELIRMYVDEQMSTIQVAKVLGISPATVTCWLKEEGVKPRTRGEALAIRNRRRTHAS